MAYCPSCGNPTGPEDKFCANCGKLALPAATAPKIEALPPAPTEPIAAALPPASMESASTGKSGKSASTMILSVVLALAVIFGGFAAWMWMDNSGQVKDLTAANDGLATEKADLSSQLSNLTSQVQALNTNITALQADKTKLAADLAALQKKYPLKDFSTEYELQNWLLSAITKLNPLDEPPAQYYMIQRLAMEDGYFMSVAIWEDTEGVYYYPELYAVADGVVYICYEDGSMYVSFVL